jgi:hypothetical protein
LSLPWDDVSIQAKEREAWSSKREAKIRSLEESNRSEATAVLKEFFPKKTSKVLVFISQF